MDAVTKVSTASATSCPECLEEWVIGDSRVGYAFDGVSTAVFDRFEIKLRRW